jgi:plasmid stabilization system protein ParE
VKAYRVVFAGRARREIVRAAAWWKDNRTDSPELLIEELAEALGKIALAPYAGADLSHPSGARRWLLHRCRYHLYYTIDDAARTVTLRAVWHATRGKGPQLK